MGNKLKELFKKRDPYGFTIHFNDSEAATEFQTKLRELLTNPKASPKENQFSVQGENIADAETFQELPEGKYPLKNISNIDKISCSYPVKSIIFTLSYQEQTNSIIFYKTAKLGNVFLQNDPESIITFSFYQGSGSEQVQFHWEIKFAKASSYAQLAKECELYYYFLIKCINPTINVIPEELKESIVILYRLAQACKRIIETEEKLGKHFSPSKCTHSDNEMSKFEYIYQTLVRGEPIKDDQSYENVTSTFEKSAPSFEIGTEILLQHNFTKIMSVAKEDIALYTMQFYFNALVNKIETGDEDNKIIFTGTDEKPLYSVKKSYLTSSDIPKMTGDITQDILPIMNAKTLSEILSDLESQERTEVEELLNKGDGGIGLEITESENIPSKKENK